MPRIDEPDTLSPVDRRRETARILARAVPRIGLAAAEWGARLARHNASRLLIAAHARPGGCVFPGCAHRVVGAAVAAGANQV